jgi:hypothetical protein
MVLIYEGYDGSVDGNYFSSYRKNLGNKLFIYACSRIMSDILNCDLICPENPIIRKEIFKTKEYCEQKFPFGSIIRGSKPPKEFKVIEDSDLIYFKNIKNIIDSHPNHGFVIKSYFSKYDYIKPYKDSVREYFKSITSPKRNDGDMVIMLRDSHRDKSFKLPDDYYLKIIEREDFNQLHISFDHEINHLSLLNKLSKYNPIIIDGNIIEVFKELTSFDKIVSCQGTFSFWVSFLSSADKIYWPITIDGPNSGINSINPVYNTYVNLLVDDEDKYQHIKVL